MLNITNAANKGIIAVINEGKDIEKCDVNIKGGDVIGKYNNKEKEKPLINYNG